jgi:transposase
MLEPLDYSEREQAFAFIGKTLGDFVPEDHLLRRLEKVVDFKRLCAPLQAAYASDVGRPAVHPEILVRALLIGRLYQVPSFRQLCRDLSYNLAYRYFCHIPLHAAIFDHSTISRFLERIGSDAFEAVCANFERSLREAGWLSDEGYLDSTLIAAFASSDGLHPTTASAQSFAEQVKEVNGLFLGPSGPATEGPPQVYQDREGRLPLPKSDPDARWAKGSRGPALLSYKVSVLSDDHGFITAHRLDRSTVADHDAGIALLSALNHLPASVTADKGYSAGEFRRALRRQGVRCHVPLPTGHPPRFLEEEGFTFNPFALLCPEGQSLKQTRKSNHRLQYRGQPQLCAGCPRLEGCRAARKYGFTLGEASRELVMAVQANRTPAYRRALGRRRCVAEGNMASLKRLGLGRLSHRGLERVGALVNLSVLAHNLLKLLALTGSRPKSRAALCCLALLYTAALIP